MKIKIKLLIFCLNKNLNHYLKVFINKKLFIQILNYRFKNGERELNWTGWS